MEGVDPRLVFKIASRSRLSDEDLARRGLEFLGDTEQWQYFVVPEEQVPQRLLDDISRYASGPDEEGARAFLANFFGLIDRIDPYGPEDRRGPGLPEDPQTLVAPMLVEITLWPSPDEAEAERRISDVRVVFQVLNGQQVAVDPRPQTTVVRARVDGQTLAELLELTVVEKVRAPLRPYVDPTDWITAQIDDFELSEAVQETIGIIDDDVASGHPLLQGRVAGACSFPETYAWQQLGPHGTMVGGLAAYGDFEEFLAAGHGRLPVPCRIYSARVLEPDPNAHEWDRWVTRFAETAPEHRSLEEAIRTLHADGVRVFNLSINAPYAYQGPHVEVLTETVDRLIRELGIVVVVSAGNTIASADGQLADDRHALHDYPHYTVGAASRVAEPGTAALALTVGSIARSAGPAQVGYTDAITAVRSHAVAGIDELSPYSRTGPGVLNAVKPELVDYGGNWVWNDFGRLDPRNAGVSVVSLATESGTGRLFACSSGTSFAAPRVAHLVAHLWSTYPDGSANLIRALIGLSATVPQAGHAQFADDEQCLRAFGYGHPNREAASSCGQNRVVMVFDGTMSVDATTIHPVPIPEAFARGKSTRRIAVALAYDPPVRRQRREYLAGTMRIDFLRAINLDEVVSIYCEQPRDRDRRLKLPQNRRRVKKLKPGSDRLLHSTLQVRCWHPNYARSMDVDDGDTYFLAVTHEMPTWGSPMLESYIQQSYALAVELHDIDRTEIDLYTLVQQRVRVPARIRLRNI